MSETKFIVVRHGETVWNAEGRIQGHLDSELNEEGLAQALLVGERLAREPFDHFYCSDLRRALQTAQPIVKRSDKVPSVTPRLRERNLGIFQGLTSEECQHKYPQEYRRFHRREVDHVMPGGESVRQLNARVSEFFDELASHLGIAFRSGRLSQSEPGFVCAVAHREEKLRARIGNRAQTQIRAPPE